MASFGVKPIVLRNVETGQEYHDRLHAKAVDVRHCNDKVCTGARMMVPAPVPGGRCRSQDETLKMAHEFLDEFYESQKKLNSQQYQNRWAQVQSEIRRRGMFDLTYEEICFGAKMAWRNAPRCIARIQWANLRVFDARHVRTAKAMFDCLLEHMKIGTNGGKLNSNITIFPPRTDGKHDYRLWNSQFISYAGYKNPDGTILGDPAGVEFTEVCLQLGWQPKRTQWDVLPMILQANGKPPELFEIPKEYIMEVEIEHPTYPWFKDLGMRWYAFPGVSGLLLDIAGVQFSAAPFNGWYTSPEIASRDLGEPGRYNFGVKVAKKLGLDTSNNATLWKDTAILELNKAVLYSFQKAGVTLWDHHTAAESFMKFFESEMRTRGGCPSDWVWLVSPMSGSLCPTYSQELACYNLKPSFEYQVPAWKTYNWNEPDRQSQQDIQQLVLKKKYRLLTAILAVRFSVALFRHVLMKRPKATILYATETGRSESFANRTEELLKVYFRVQCKCMNQYDVNKELNEEQLLIVVTSTFGNGDPPTNGVTFQQAVKASKDAQKKLKNLRFAVFALGSSAYPNFCAFGKYVDQTLAQLGGHRLVDLVCADELKGQDSAFRIWSQQLFVTACQTLSQVHEDVALAAMSDAMAASRSSLVVHDYRLEIQKGKEDLLMALAQTHNKTLSLTRVLRKTNLNDGKSDKSVINLALDTFSSKKLHYEPGDHLAIFPANQPLLVSGLTSRLQRCPEMSDLVELQQSKAGSHNQWHSHPKFPKLCFGTLLSRVVDLSAPPSQELLELLAKHAESAEERQKLRNLARDYEKYRQWQSWACPNIVDLLNKFPSISIHAATLIANLSILQPRYYSISSSAEAFPGELHLTVAIVKYATEGGMGPERYGVCSSYLNQVQEGDFITCYIKSYPNFHLPEDVSKPIIMIGPGTGIAPFRGFWQHKALAKKSGLIGYKDVLKKTFRKGKPSCQTVLYQGCQTRSLRLYASETEKLVKNGVIDKVQLALSREQSVPKTYVQDLLRQNGAEVCQTLLDYGGHIYICGDATMATQVYHTLKEIIANHGHMDENQAKYILETLKEELRYHEDIFGAQSEDLGECEDDEQDYQSVTTNFAKM